MNNSTGTPTHPSSHTETSVSVSGITPSGRLTLGNYLGALRRFATERDPGPAGSSGFFFVADLHAMTAPHEPARLAALTRETALLLLASGLPPGTVFVQSEVPAHAQLAYLLECTAHVGELSRMIQFRHKGRDRPGARAALLTYPCLMAADILLYGAERVPVGGDQDQHVELARDLAIRFNHTYGPTFRVPELVHPVTAVRVRDLLDPASKMDKSARDDASGVIRVLDDPDTIRRKVGRAVTDAGSQVGYDPAGRPGAANLLDILAACAGGDPATLAAAYPSYAALKRDVADAVIAELATIQRRYAELAPERAGVNWALRRGRERAAAAAQPTLEAAMAAMGLR
jgi:tryptophanyl-tRNA synthetase